MKAIKIITSELKDENGGFPFWKWEAEIVDVKGVDEYISLQWEMNNLFRKFGGKTLFDQLDDVFNKVEKNFFHKKCGDALCVGVIKEGYKNAYIPSRLLADVLINGKAEYKEKQGVIY